MRGVYNSACSSCYKTIGVTKNIRLLLRDGLLFRRLLLPESTVVIHIDKMFNPFKIAASKNDFLIIESRSIESNKNRNQKGL